MTVTTQPQSGKGKTCLERERILQVLASLTSLITCAEVTETPACTLKIVALRCKVHVCSFMSGFRSFISSETTS